MAKSTKREKGSTKKEKEGNLLSGGGYGSGVLCKATQIGRSRGGTSGKGGEERYLHKREYPKNAFKGHLEGAPSFQTEVDKGEKGGAQSLSMGERGGGSTRRGGQNIPGSVAEGVKLE